MHPSYDSDNQNFDFALLILKNPIKFSNKANAACVLSDETELYSGLDLIVSGWGNLAGSGHIDEFPDWLQVSYVLVCLFDLNIFFFLQFYLLLSKVHFTDFLKDSNT